MESFQSQSNFSSKSTEMHNDFTPNSSLELSLILSSSNSPSSEVEAVESTKTFQLMKDIASGENTNSVQIETAHSNAQLMTVNSNEHDDKDSSDIDSENEEIIMFVIWKCGKFAAAYYNIKTSEISILNEINDSTPEHNMLKNLYRQVQPIIVVTDSRASQSLVACLKTLILDKTSDYPVVSNINEDSKLRYGLNFVSLKEYSSESCKRRILHLNLPNEPANASEHDRELFLNSIINFRYLQTTHATGALLKYLDKNWVFLAKDSSATPCILGINIISLDKILTMDNESYKALQIFDRFSHPSNFKKGTPQSAKERLSIYGIFNRCCSKIGMQYLRLMLQHPTNDIKVLECRLNTIEFCNKPGNEEVVKSICSCLRKIKNVNGIMTRIKALRATPAEWSSLFETLYNAVSICEICENFETDSLLINALGSRNNEDLFQVAHHMNRVIDFELSNVEGKFTVKLGVDPQLDQKRQMMTGLHGLMSLTAKYELDKLPSYVEECTMVYLPNLGYLLGIKAWKTKLNQEEKNIPNLRYMFQNGEYIYYKTEGCEELDERIGDTYPEILAHEMRIMMRLTQFIMQHLQSLSSVVKMCAELDCLISIAKVCKDNDYKRPKLTFQKVIDIKQGRHPLQELCVENFVPNDTLSSSSENLVTVLTGPNSCGKSIYLKQIALIVYMAHIGCFVPAESATIGFVDNLFTRIQTVEDISTRMSAFLIDLRQMSQAINHSTNASLIIIDEFGKGTTDVDGLGLLAASINHFLFRKQESPHVFVSTHFHHLKEYLIQSQLLTNMSMEYLFQEDKLIFLYKLVKNDGKNNSFAHQVAQNVGIDEDICMRAKHIFENINKCYPSVDETLTRSFVQRMLIHNMKNILCTDNKVTKDTIKVLMNGIEPFSSI